MTITAKLPLLVLLAFLMNAVLLMGYYQFFLSTEISSSYSETQATSEALAAEIAGEVQGSASYADALGRIARDEDLKITVQDMSGNVVLTAGEISGVNIEFSGASIVELGGAPLLLKVTKPMALDILPSIVFAQKIMIAESVIVFCILVGHTLIIHFNHVRPIVRLRQDMDNYRKGVKPQSTRRRDEIGWLRNQFVELTGVLDEERQKQSRIIASISHDIKTPLTSVMGYAERLKKGNVPPERVGDYVNVIYAKSLDIKEMVDEFDEYLGYNMESSLKLQPTTTGHVCELVREDFAEELEGMGASLSVSCVSPEVGVKVDLPKLRRVFGNIITNSVRYGKRPVLQIDIHCHQDGPSVVFTVSDNGSGVPGADLQRIFEPLYTSDESRSVSGLGLSICKSIIERHGGRIWAENNPEGGLTVSFAIPAV